MADPEAVAKVGAARGSDKPRKCRTFAGLQVARGRSTKLPPMPAARWGGRSWCWSSPRRSINRALPPHCLPTASQAFTDHYYATFDTARNNLAGLYQDQSMLTFEGQKFQGTQAVRLAASQLVRRPVGGCCRAREGGVGPWLPAAEQLRSNFGRRRRWLSPPCAGRPSAHLPPRRTCPQILQKLTSLPFQQCKHHISSLDAQPSLSGGVLVFVTGQLLVGVGSSFGWGCSDSWQTCCTMVGGRRAGCAAARRIHANPREQRRAWAHHWPAAAGGCCGSRQARRCSADRSAGVQGGRAKRMPAARGAHVEHMSVLQPWRNAFPSPPMCSLQPEGETNPLKFSQTFHLAPVGGSYVVTNGACAIMTRPQGGRAGGVGGCVGGGGGGGGVSAGGQPGSAAASCASAAQHPWATPPSQIS